MGSSGTIGAVLSDGRIALIDGIGRLVVLRSDGSVDPGFNAGRPWSSGDVLSALLPGPGDGLLVVGTVGLSDAQMHRRDEIAVAALHSDSTPDTSFAGPTTRTQVRAKLVPGHPLAADVTVPRAGALLVQAWDRRHH